MDDDERTARMIRQIDSLVASPTLHKTRKLLVLREFTGQIVGRHSVRITHWRCAVADKIQLVDREWCIRLLYRCIHEHSWRKKSSGDRVLLHRVLKRARQNGWDGGDAILDTLAEGKPFDEGYVLRGLLTLDDFLDAFWQGENLTKHRLGLTLFDDPLTYLSLYV